MAPIRIAIIGTGGGANSHANDFKKDPDVRVVACCDILPDLAKAFAERHSIPAAYANYRKLLSGEELDAVVVATSDAAHCEVSCAALERGLHVLCEKPLATSAAEARRMLRTAIASGKIHMVNFSYRSFPALELAQKLISEGLLGNIRHVEASYLQSWLATDAWGDWREKPAFLWRMSRKYSGGTLADIGCHIMDFTTHAVGRISSLSCSMKSFDKGVRGNRWKGYKLDADDSFIATVQFASGALGVIHATRWASGHHNCLRLRVFGDGGGLVIDSETGRDKLQVCLGKFHVRHALWTTMQAKLPDVPIYARFLRSIRSGVPEPPTFEDGFRARLYQDACIRSASTGKPVRLRD